MGPGWTLILNPDGTTTAWNPDKTKVLRSHSPQPGPGNPPGDQGQGQGQGQASAGCCRGRISATGNSSSMCRYAQAKGSPPRSQLVSVRSDGMRSATLAAQPGEVGLILTAHAVTCVMARSGFRALRQAGVRS